jgi:hypothetical protein
MNATSSQVGALSEIKQFHLLINTFFPFAKLSPAEPSLDSSHSAYNKD